MTQTPWGDSSELRTRKLAPGSRLPPETVAFNQRWRLMAAMLACVAERGYVRTTLGNVTQLSGVSRTSFYNHFANKEACFLATVDAAVDFATTVVTDAYDRHDNIDDRLAAAFGALARGVAAQPAAARVGFVPLVVIGWNPLAAEDKAKLKAALPPSRPSTRDSRRAKSRSRGSRRR